MADAPELDAEKMSYRSTGMFTGILLLAVGLSVSLILTIIAVQAGYTGIGPILKAVSDTENMHAIALSLCTTTVASLLALLLAIPTGYALARWNFKGVWLIDALLVVPVVMSPMSLGVALLLLFQTSIGKWVDQNLVRFVFEVPGIILAQFFLAYAFSVLVTKTTFAGIDVRLEQVARFLGCSRWKAFRYVSLPLARNGIIAAFILAWARAIGDFGSTSTIGGAVAGETETIPISIYLNLATVSLDQSVALSLLLTFVTIAAVMVICFLLQKR